jgi:hypothetical protein
MLTENNQLCSVNRLQTIEFLEERIGWWATRASLGSKQLDQYGIPQL